MCRTRRGWSLTLTVDEKVPCLFRCDLVVNNSYNTCDLGGRWIVDIVYTPLWRCT